MLWPASWTYSEYITTFHPPPHARRDPVINAGRTAGRMMSVTLFHPFTPKTAETSVNSVGRARAAVTTLKRRYQTIASISRMNEAISWLTPAGRDPCKVTKSGRKTAR